MIASVADWPAIDRITLARKVLETVEESTMPAAGELRGQEVIKLLQIPQPAPDDDDCDRIVAEERAVLHEAESLSGTDFEDNVCIACATYAAADWIVTREVQLPQSRE